MKFITETDLRDRYRIQAFTRFELEKGSRLTPGGRQFILDRRIELVTPETAAATPSSDGHASKNSTSGTTPAFDKNFADLSPKASAGTCSLALKYLAGQMLETVLDLPQTCEDARRDLIDIQDHLRQMATGLATLPSGADLSKPVNCKAMNSKSMVTAPSLEVICCAGITHDNFSLPLADCFELGAGHLACAQARLMIRLDGFRCCLRRIGQDNTVESMAQGIHQGIHQGFHQGIYQAVNRLSQMICTAMGEKTCQRNR